MSDIQQFVAILAISLVLGVYCFALGFYQAEEMYKRKRNIKGQFMSRK